MAYSGDCRPSRAFARLARGCSVVIHEATFEDSLADHAERKRHCTTAEALAVAAEAGCPGVILTHFSQRYPMAAPEAGPGRNAASAFDGMTVPLDRVRAGGLPPREPGAAARAGWAPFAGKERAEFLSGWPPLPLPRSVRSCPGSAGSSQRMFASSSSRSGSGTRRSGRRRASCGEADNRLGLCQIPSVRLGLLGRRSSSPPVLPTLAAFRLSQISMIQ